MLSPAFRERLLSRLIISPDTGCLLWTGAKDSRGYGHIAGPERIQLRTHRVMYELFVGPIPDGMEIDHLCRNRSCASPAHLEAVTHGENVRRGMSPAALAMRQTHCVKGHEFNSQNTRVTEDGNRLCRPCRREASRQYKARRRVRSA